MPNSSNIKETIDERILRLIGLEDVFDLDYDTYLTLLKEQMVKGRMSQSKIPIEEVELLTDEYKRVKGKKGAGRFGVKKKKINTQSFGVAKFTPSVKKIKAQKLIPSKPQMLLPPGKEMGGIKTDKSDPITTIIKSLGNIIKILNNSYALDKKYAEKNRISKERGSRDEEESRLEKGLGLVKKVASKIVSPVKNILSQILDFFMKLFVAEVVYKLLEWLGNHENQQKLKSIFRFLGDHWPILLALYLRFGTGIGKFAGKLTSILIRGGIKLAAATAKLLAKAGIEKASGAARFLGGSRGKLLGAGLQVAATVGTTMALSNGLEKFGGIDGEESKTSGYSGGGSVRFPKFAGGGFNFGGFGNMFNGLVSGKKGVDQIPAMLSDGEFVMSRGAVQKYGVDTLESMNAAGGGTNKPKMISGVPHAYGGGYITSTGRQDSRANYDAKYGAGAYDRELAKRRARYAAEDAADIERNRKLNDWKNRSTQRPSGQKKATGDKKITVNGVNVTPLAGLAGGIQGATRGMGPNVAITRDKGMTPEMQKKLVAANKESAQMDASRARQASIDKQARHEYAKIINNPDDPRYQAAWDGTLKMSDIEKEVREKAARSAVAPTVAPAAKPALTPAAAKPATARASTNIPQKYYQANSAATEKQLSKLSSQKRLDILSSQGAGSRTGRGRRYTAENLARFGESEKRGGILGGIGRGLTRMFGTGDQISKINAADKASDARVKQAGAASIGRYYSSSDGKYYKDFNAAAEAKKARLAKQQPGMRKGAPPPIKPKTRFTNPSQGGSTTKSQTVGRSNSPSSPKISATHPAGTKNKEAVHGLKR